MTSAVGHVLSQRRSMSNVQKNTSDVVNVQLTALTVQLNIAYCWARKRKITARQNEIISEHFYRHFHSKLSTSQS